MAAGIGFGLIGGYGYIHGLDLWGVWMIAGGMIVYDA